MKKNVLKILLAFVVIAMMFALVACGKSGGNGGKTTPTPAPETPTEEATDPTALAAALNSVINNVTPIMDTVKGISTEKKVALDLGLGGYYTNTEGGGGFKVNAAVNAGKNAPEFKFGVAVNTEDTTAANYKDYFSLGYSNGKIYLIEGLNLINSSATGARKIEMDASYFKDGVENVVTQATKYLENGVKGFTLDLSKATGLITSMKSSLAKIIKLSEKDNVTEFIIPNTKISDIVKLLKEMVFKDKWEDIEKGINTALEYAGNVIPALKDATFTTVLNEFAPSINIKAEYTGSGDSKTLTNIKLAIAFGENLKNLEFGLNVDLTKFSLNDKADISFTGYSAQNLTSKVSVNLGGINHKATLELNLNTATGLKNETNNLATAILSLDEAKNNYAATASFDGKDFNMDLGAFLGKLGLDDSNAQYTQSVIMPKLVIDETTNAYNWDEEQAEAINLKTVLKQMLEGWKYVQPAEDDDDDDDEEEEVVLPENISKFESSGIWAMIYNMLLFESGDYVDSDGYLCYVIGGEVVYVTDEEGERIVTEKKETATSDDVLDLLGKYVVAANAFVGPFINFDVVDNQGEALPFNTIWENIKTQFNSAKSNFEGDDSAAQVNGTEASVVVYGANNGKSLIKFLSYFIKVPALKDGAPDIDTESEPWEIGETTDQITPALVKSYIEWVFGLDDEDAAENYAEWNADLKRIFKIGEQGFTTEIIKVITGKTYTQLVDDGLALYAKYDENRGLSGEVGIKSANAAGTIYIGLGASIGFSSSASVAAVNVAEDAELCVNNEVFSENLWGHIINVIDYIFGEKEVA